jgi:class I lanthipeptide synthase
MPFLPRVQAGRCVLRLAQWRIDAASGYPQLVGGGGEGFAAAFARWRERWRVPQHVFLNAGGDGTDHRLLLDLDDSAHAEEVRRHVRRIPDHGAVVLQEACPGLDEAWVHGPGGRYASELVVSMVQRGPPEGPRLLRPPAPAVSRQVRLRPPGSDWAFVKLYCDRAAIGPLVAGPVLEFALDLQSCGDADQWIFVRYADPEPHLRLRVHGESSRLVPALCTWAGELMAQELVSRFVLDTYEREIERYGGPAGMSAAEALFAADSRAVADLLRLDLAGALPVDRLILAFAGIDDLLAGLGLDEPARLRLYQHRAGRQRTAGTDYRRRREELCAALRAPMLEAVPGAGAVRDVLARRRTAVAAVAVTLNDLANRGTLAKPLPELCHSYIHMHCNRLLGADRNLEHTVLELLLRTRWSLQAGAERLLEH